MLGTQECRFLRIIRQTRMLFTLSFGGFLNELYEFAQMGVVRCACLDGTDRCDGGDSHPPPTLEIYAARQLPHVTVSTPHVPI